MPEMRNALEIDSVVLTFGDRTVLNGVYLKVEAGEVVGLLGRNGCGKTCLLKILFGSLKALNATRRLNGKYLPVGKLFPKAISYAPQFHFIPEFLTVKRIFADYEASYSDFEHNFPGLSITPESRVGQLSSGERKLIEIFIVLKGPASFCLLDEPFSFVMPKHIAGIKSLLRDEAAAGRGIVIVDHMFREVVDVSDRMYFMKDGSTREIGTILEHSDEKYLDFYK